MVTIKKILGIFILLNILPLIIWGLSLDSTHEGHSLEYSSFEVYFYTFLISCSFGIIIGLIRLSIYLVDGK